MAIIARDGFNYLYLNDDKSAYDSLIDTINSKKIEYKSPDNQKDSVIYGHNSSSYTKLAYYWIKNYSTFEKEKRHKQFINALAQHCSVNDKNELCVDWYNYLNKCIEVRQKEVIPTHLTPKHAELVGKQNGVNGQLYIFEGVLHTIQSYLNKKEFSQETNNIVHKINRLVCNIPCIEHARNFVKMFNEAIHDGTNAHVKLSEAANELKMRAKFPGTPFADKFALCKLPGTEMTCTVSNSAWIPQRLYDKEFVLVLRSDNANVSNGEAWLASAGLFYSKNRKFENPLIST